MPTPFDLAGKRVFVAGHRGMVGSALVRRLASERCTILTAGRDEADLRRQDEAERLLQSLRPEVVIVAAATVGGILDNASRPATFLYDNLMIEANLIEGARRVRVEKLLFLGSTCIFPREAPQPLKEESLLTGPLEKTNEWYAIAKIAGIKLCDAYRRQHGCDFISAQPTNLYGPNDNYDREKSHVLAALLRKVHEAKVAGADTVTLWGSGTPLREFLHADDLADALVFLLRTFSDEGFVNVGSGDELSILDLARLIGSVVGWQGRFLLDPAKPDGTPRKAVDSSKLAALGWRRKIPLKDGIAQAYAWFLAHA
ncbi:MAG: GDP-L-fucose synthase, partial [Alphaproteobacteria bacterium]|nr:GDP-L-fucose synthase [Alphaproteobacteria bacterium]